MPAKNVSKAKSAKPTPPKKVKKVTPPKKVSKSAPKAESKVEKTVEKPVEKPVVEAAVSKHLRQLRQLRQLRYLIPLMPRSLLHLCRSLTLPPTLVRNLKSRLPALEKQVHRDHKAAQKKLRGKRRAPILMRVLRDSRSQVKFHLS